MPGTTPPPGTIPAPPRTRRSHADPTTPNGSTHLGFPTTNLVKESAGEHRVAYLVFGAEACSAPPRRSSSVESRWNAAGCRRRR